MADSCLDVWFPGQRQKKKKVSTLSVSLASSSSSSTTTTSTPPPVSLASLGVNCEERLVDGLSQGDRLQQIKALRRQHARATTAGPAPFQ